MVGPATLFEQQPILSDHQHAAHRRIVVGAEGDRVTGPSDDRHRTNVQPRVGFAVRVPTATALGKLLISISAPKDQGLRRPSSPSYGAVCALVVPWDTPAPPEDAPRAGEVPRPRLRRLALLGLGLPRAGALDTVCPPPPEHRVSLLERRGRARRAIGDAAARSAGDVLRRARPPRVSSLRACRARSCAYSRGTA